MEEFNSDKCPLGIENKTRISGMEKAIEGFIQRTENSVGQLTNHYSKRLPVWATILISLLASVSTGLGIYFLTKGH